MYEVRHITKNTLLQVLLVRPALLLYLRPLLLPSAPRRQWAAKAAISAAKILEIYCAVCLSHTISETSR